MKPKYKKFTTEKEALAFIAGVDYVNDSSLTATYRGKHLNGYLVMIEDQDENQGSDPSQTLDK